MIRKCKNCNCDFVSTHDNRKICSDLCRFELKEKKKKIPFKHLRTSKKCIGCNEELTLDKFRKCFRKDGNSYLSPRCRPCETKYSKEAYHSRPRSGKEYNSMTKYRYGLSKEDFYLLKKEQDGKCKICGREMKKYNIDHCHKTGKIRGILCTSCNMGIGMFKDDVELLEKVISYLKAN